MPESRRPDDEGASSDARGPIRAEFDWSDVLPSTAVVETVAIATDREPMALGPLYDAIDPDALDTLVRSGGTDPTDGIASVTFALDGHEVTVRRDGTVVVIPVEARSKPE